MADPKIRLKRSSVEGKIPTPDQVPLGEIALNTYDGYLYASKNVGIGTTVIAINPFRVGTGTDTYNAYFTAGNVGIGTETPTTKLDVDGTVNATVFAGYDYIQAPHGGTVNYSVTVVSKTAAHRYNGTGSGNGYAINGVESPFLTFTPGRTYRFTLSSGDMSSHPFRFYLEADKTTAYTTNVTSTATYTEIVVTDTTPPVLHYQCSAHGYMGNAVQVNSSKVNTPYNIEGLAGANISGVVTATSFSGSGSNLTGLTGASASTYGSAGATPVIVVDANGRITGISTVAISGGGSVSEAFKTISVSGQSDVVADSATDTLTFVAGSNMTITTNAGGDSITFASSGGGGGSGISSVAEDTTPQLGGNLDLNSKDITGTGNLNVTGIITSTTLSVLDDKVIQFGDSQDLKIYHKTEFERYNEKRILASDAYGGDSGFPPFDPAYDGGIFGFSVAVSDTKVLIGAPGDADNGGDRYGAGYLYSHDGTSEVILSNDSGSLYELGHSVGLGTTAAYIGRIYGVNGEVKVFDFSGTIINTITASDGANQDYFGSAIGVGTSKIVIGAYGDDDNGSESGSAYIFNLDGTSQVKIDASDGEASDRFGYSVGIGGTVIVVGAYQEDTVASNAGKAYIFDLSGNQLGIITASNGAANDYFGFSVDVNSDKIVIGAYNKNSNQGSVYVYDHKGSNETIITASDAANSDQFGYDVAINESNIFVSAPFDDDSGTNSGSIYVYDLDGSNEIKLTNSTTSEEGFGKAIAVNSSKLVVGAPDADDFDYQAGAAYIFDSTPQNTYLDNYTGDLTIRNNVSSDVGGNIILQAKSGENSVVCNDDGSVELYYDNSKKIETISTGATVTGDLYSSSNIFVSDDNGFKAGKSGDLLINHSSTDGIKLTASDGVLGDYYGTSVAIGTSKIVVGARLGADDVANNAGAAYIYNLDKTDEIKITASDGGSTDNFGISVGIGGTIIVVGANQWDGTTQSNCGSFYIFDLSGNQLGLVSASDQGGSDKFGEAVAVGPTKIVSGAPGDASSRGSAYLFDHKGANQIKLTASDGAGSDKFGSSVGIGGTIVVVGAPNDHVGSTSDQGSAYIFDLSGNQLGIITASNGTASDLFGVSVGVGGTIIVVGSRNGNGVVDGSGSVYIYDHKGNALGIVSASDGAVADYFGWSVDTDGNKIVVGAYLDDDNGTGSGSLYIYDDKGENEQKVTAFDGAIDDNFGFSVATGAGKIVVGARGDDINDNTDQGSAYIFNQSVNSSYIENKTGDLIIRNTGSGGNVLLQATSGENSVICNDNGSVELYYDDTKRLETVSTGATVTGTMYATALSGDGSNITGISTLNIVNYSGGGGGGGASEAFKTISVSGQSDVVADSTTDTLTLVAGSNMTITTNASGDSITFASSGGGGGSSSVRTVNRYVATQNQTLFPPSGTVSYTVGYLDVYLNGSRLDTTEFTASNGTTVTLTTGASANDIVELIAFTNVGITSVTVVDDSTPQLGGDLDLNGNNITGTGNINITGTATVTGGQVATQNDAIAFAIALG